MAIKRKAPTDLQVQPGKRIKIMPDLSAETVQTAPPPPSVVVEADEPATKASPVNRKKLPPRRPIPTVPTSSAATVPYSARSEGKNMICITRKTNLGAYMRRCKDLILKDGYKTITFYAMGAAISLLVQLSVALPPILPFHTSEITTEITTGTSEVCDELITTEGDQESTFETRSKSTLSIVLKIGDGLREQATTNHGRRKTRKPPLQQVPDRTNTEGKKKSSNHNLFQEPEQTMDE